MYCILLYCVVIFSFAFVGYVHTLCVHIAVMTQTCLHVIVFSCELLSTLNNSVHLFPCAYHATIPCAYHATTACMCLYKATVLTSEEVEI